jgi:hypothetical protein
MLVEYAATLVARDSPAVDRAAPLVGGTLLVVAELAYWSIELRGKEREERSVVVRRVGTLVALAAAAPRARSERSRCDGAPARGGLVWNALGVAAAVAVLALITRLVAGDPRPRRPPLWNP